MLMVLFIELLEKAVQLLHSLVKLLGRQHIIFHRIHLGIIDIEGPPGLSSPEYCPSL